MNTLRIVSLLPSATELVCALGLRGSLVGVSHACDEPQNVVSLPRVTSSVLSAHLSAAEIDTAVSTASREGRVLYAIDRDRLERLRPDLIVTQGLCAVCAVSESAVRGALGVEPLEAVTSARIVSLCGTDWAGIRADLRMLGDATGRRHEADRQLESLDERWDRLARTAAAGGPSVVMLEWPDPPWCAGHWVPEQVAVAGGRDGLGRAGAPSARVTWDALRAADPDDIVGIACGFDVASNRAHLLRAVAGPLAGLRAVESGRVWAADANGLFSRPGPRVVTGAEVLRQIFTGQSVRPEHAARLYG